MTLQQLVRPNILNLAPYTCARDEFSGVAEAWLDANENSMIDGLNRYPDPLQHEVKRRIAALRGVDTANIFLGVGSDECIDITYRTFCRPSVDNVVAIDPTYGMYSVCAAINDVEYRTVPLRPDFSLDEEALLTACDERTKVIWICSPNNPTANAFPIDAIERVASKFQGITVVDEAYVDFSPYGSMVKHIADMPRLIVMQTFSKAWASAAMRLGIAYASPEIVSIFNKVRYPYNINILTQRRAIQVLDRADEVARVARDIIAERQHLAERLTALPQVVEVYPSDANFLLVKTTDADGIYKYLCDNGIVVRNRSRVKLCDGCLRITVGTPDENRLLLSALANSGTPASICAQNDAADLGSAEVSTSHRRATRRRATSETDITVTVDLDGTGRPDIDTGIGFFDHMLAQIARHGGIDLTVKAKGDLFVDEHHTIEDTAIVLGEAIREALGDKRGIERYGFVLPMDDCLATVALDFGGRAWLQWDATFSREKIGDMPTEMFHHFFKSLSDAMAANLFIRAEGTNEHHKIEGIFKALARALRQAIHRDPASNAIPSSKGTL